MRYYLWMSIIFSLLCSSITYADAPLVQRQDVQQFINKMVKDHHFSRSDLIATFKEVQLQPQIIGSMERPFEKKNWDVYRDLFLTPQRLKGGIDFWAANKTALDQAQKKYGVPAEIIVAILGVETLYGERQGENRVLDALATLAFDYPKRARYFSKELEEYLLLCREHQVPATYFKGSYAGAIGKPQFMPSSYRYYAVDFYNKGRRDLVRNNADAIGSVANYFHKHGWKYNAGVAQTAKINGWSVKRLYLNPKKANYNYDALVAAGVKPLTAAANHPSRAGLIELVTAVGKEYWIAYPNFFVITRYNSSPQYALVVYLLAQQLKQQRVAANAHKFKAFA